MEYKDYYTVLEINSNASQEEIKAAYRKLAWKYHPDRNKGDQLAEERLKDVNEAFRVLSDVSKRQQYDRQLKSIPRSPLKTAHTSEEEAPVNHLSKFFHKVFNTSTEDAERKKAANHHRKDESPKTKSQSDSVKKPTSAGPQKRIEYPVKITLKEAFEGAERSIQISGRKIAVSIPEGVRTGTQVKVKIGDRLNSLAEQAEVFLIIEVLEDSRFKRKGDDLYTEVAVSLYTAILGGSVPIETFHGKGVLTIPPGTQPDQLFRLKGKGMPHLQQPEHYGDLYAQVKIHLPDQLTEHQKALFERLASSG